MSEMKYSQLIITDAVPLGLNEKGPAVPRLEDLKSIKSTHLDECRCFPYAGFFLC
jgi:hypothetical protein